MSHGFMVMTWKQRPNLHSRRAKHPPDPQKLAKFNPKSRCCSQFFFMLVELSTTSTFLKAPQWTRPTTLKFWNVWGMPSDGKGQNCGGVVTGFSIMTTLQPIQPSELMNFWPNIPSLFFPTLFPIRAKTLLQFRRFSNVSLIQSKQQLQVVSSQTKISD